MEYEIADLKKLRKQLGITQSELAKRSGVSQSIIAKIESGHIDPSYSKIKSIFATLDSLSRHTEKKASDIMQKKVVMINPKTKIRDAISVMRKHGISQIPVVNNEQIIGVVSENTLLELLATNTKAAFVEDAMDDNPPTVSENSSVKIVVSLLKFYPLVAVIEKGRIKGIITKSDVLNNMY